MPRTKWAGRRRATRNPPAPAAPEKPPLPTDIDELVAEIEKCCDAHDAEMANKERTLRMTPTRYGSPIRLRLNELLEALRKALLQREEPVEDLDGYLIERLMTPPGQVPPFSRPGRFLIWCGFVPIGCEWDGYPLRGARICAVDPAQLYLGGAPAAARVGDTIGMGIGTVEEHFRALITSATLHTAWERGRRQPGFTLEALDAAGRAEAAEYAAANAWIAPLLKRGPVNPIPLPPHLQSVQLSL